MRHRIYFLLILLLTICIRHQVTAQMSSTDSLFIDHCYTQADYHWYTNFDSSYHYLDLIEKKIEHQPMTDYFIASRLDKTQLCAEHVRSDLLYQELLINDVVLKNNTTFYDSIYHNVSIYLTQQWGDYYFHIGNYKKATDVYVALLDSLELPNRENNSYDSLLIAKFYTTLGNTYKKMGQYEKAISFLDKRLTFVPYLNQTAPGTAREGYNYLLKADIYLLKKDFKAARFFLDKAYLLNKKSYQKNNAFRGRIINNSYSYAKYFIMQEQADSAIHFLKKSFDFHKVDDHYFGNTYFKLAEALTANQSFNEAEKYLLKALPIIIKKYTEKSKETAQVHAALAKNELQQGNYLAALEHQQNALQAVCIDNNIVSDISTNPTISDSFSEKELLNILISKADILHTLLKKENNTTNLNHTYQTAQAALSVLNNLRLEKLEAEDKRTLSAQTSNLFKILMATAHQHYTNTKDEKYLSDIFLYMENAKSQILLEQLSDNQAKFNAGLPKTIIEQQQQFLFDINDLKNKYALHSDKTTAEAITSKEALWKEQKEYDIFLSQLKNDYPTYTSNKNSLELISLEDSQKLLLTDEQSFINYFLSDDFIYIFVINKNDKELFKIPYQFNINEQVNSLRDGLFGYHLSDRQTEQLYLEKNSIYCQSAYDFYLQLLAPIQKKLGNELIIIPDGILAYIPFEVLLTKKLEDCSAFKNMPYFFRNYDIHYAFSISSLSKMKTQKAINQKGLVFAPSFEPENEVDKTIASIRGGLGALKYNQEEAIHIKTLLGGELFSHQDANKNVFIEECHQYGIIHIASHGKTNDDKPYQSFIAFGNQENEKLYLSQLSALSLNTEMIVLSACEMGIGKLSQGEGLQSMSAGFVSAGTKSILASLWSVNDASTATIMQDFYALLAAGKKKNAAISQAKKNYLNEADHFHAHPFFWSGFVVTGDECGLEFRSFSYWWLVGGGVLVLCGVVWFRYRS